MIKSAMVKLWSAWELIFRTLWRVRPIHDTDEHLFFVSMRRYLGSSFTVDDVTVNRLDYIIELHFNNDVFFRTLREQRSLVGVAVKLIQEAKRSLPVLADYVRQPQFAKANVLMGVTFIHRGVQRFGFHTFPIQQRWMHYLTSWHLSNVVRVVNPNGSAMLEAHPSEFVPMIVAISKAKLIAEHGTDGALTTPGVARPARRLTETHD